MLVALSQARKRFPILPHCAVFRLVCMRRPLTDVLLFTRRLEQQERERQERERQEQERQERERLERERQAAAGEELCVLPPSLLAGPAV